MLKIGYYLILIATFISAVISHGAPPSAAEMLERRQINQPLPSEAVAMYCRNERRRALCILTPEVTQGPYHILGERVRQNITQGQAGIPLELDVDFFDFATCEPVPKVWVDGWSCNATGFYSGYEAASAATNVNAIGSASQPPPPAATGTGAATDADDPDHPVTSPPGDTDSFLRGAWQADDSGHLTMLTVVPGWYSGRAVHFHIKTYTEGSGSLADNGTFISGSAVHTGQFFFADDFMEKVGNTTPYNTSTVTRLTNPDDIWYAYQNAFSYTADMDIALVDSNDIAAGVLGSISLGLNLTFTSLELADFYWTGNAECSSSLAASETASAT